MAKEKHKIIPKYKIGDYIHNASWPNSISKIIGRTKTSYIILIIKLYDNADLNHKCTFNIKRFDQIKAFSLNLEETNKADIKHLLGVKND